MLYNVCNSSGKSTHWIFSELYAVLALVYFEFDEDISEWKIKIAIRIDMSTIII